MKNLHITALYIASSLTFLRADAPIPIPPTAEEQLAQFKLPEGFVIELIATEKNGLINPIDITFDDAGRLWTQTARMYPLDPLGSDIDFGKLVKIVGENSDEERANHPEYKRIQDLYQLTTRGTDQILLIPDPTQQVEGSIPVFAEGLTIPQSVLPYKNGVYVAHGSEMLFFEDPDQDGKADTHRTVLTGFGFNDSHTLTHTLVRGPGGWVHFSQGALNKGVVKAVASGNTQLIDYSKIARFSLDEKEIEIVSTGLNNIWGFQLAANGQWYGTEANDKGFSVIPMEPMTGFSGIGGHKTRDYHPWMPPPHSFRVGSTSISGLAFSDDESNGFPPEWKNLAFLANPRTNSINTVRLERDAAGKITGTHLTDLLQTSDEWFRPVNIEFGPDGSLYIADFCNKVIGHNGVPADNPNRDQSHGRLWRLRHKSQKQRPVPNLIAATDADLVKHLSGPSRWEKRAAWHQISDRKATSLLPQIKLLALNTESHLGTRMHALWSYESLGQYDEELTTRLVSDANPDIRREAIRSLINFELPTETLIKFLTPAISDPHHLVRSQALRTLEEVNRPHQEIVKLLVSACRPRLSGDGTGGPYEREFERFLARKALEQYSSELAIFLNQEEASTFPVENIFWAIQALPEKEFGNLFTKFWTAESEREVSSDIFVTLSNFLHNPAVSKAVAADFKNPKNFPSLLNHLLAEQEKLKVHNLKNILTPALKATINSKSKEEQLLAIKATIALSSKAILPEITALMTGNIDNSLFKDALSALLLDPAKSEATLLALTTQQTLSSSQRRAALKAYNQVNQSEGSRLYIDGIKNNTFSATSLISELSYSQQGAQTLVDILEADFLQTSEIDFASASRLEYLLGENNSTGQIAAIAKKKQAEQKALSQKKIAQYTKAYQTLEGNPTIGKAIFGSCLVCHAVGDTGHHIAPPLDGSSSRELEDILTAIVDPDAATEIGYNLFRVLRKDGTLVEGLLEKRGKNGLTLKIAGNIKVFIYYRDHQASGDVRRRSFMPTIFNNFPDQAMIDLVAYIKSLK